ncbi:hypothetical protein [Alteromonas sp. CYL-A6]|uniref:hypothetical protein n=1 Tax=Alteromonas nitratireducens TaxID=3390813 RepID=UPI0034B05B2D
MWKSILSGVVLASALFTSSDVNSQIIKTNDLNRYCDQDGINRQTVIYLDQGVIAKRDALWYKDIVNKLRFLPSERVKVVTIKDGGSEVELAWEGCYPGWTPENAKKIKESEGAMTLFTGSALDAVKDDLKFFTNNFQRALAHPLAGSKYEDKPRFTMSNFPAKKLVEALYYDSKRLDLDNGVSRVIVFSDMIEKSGLVDHKNMRPVETAEAVAKRFPMFLNHADFYIYGINYTHSESDLNTDMERFWRDYLLHSGANIAHYGNQLVVPRGDENFAVTSYTGYIVDGNGNKIITKMRLGYFPNGELTHSVLTVGDEFLPIKGSIIKSGQNIQLTGTVTASTFDGFSEGDVVKLAGSLKDMQGQIGAPDDRTVDKKGQQYIFDLSLSRDANLSL